MPTIVQVAVELSLNREFDYLVPEALLEQVRLGSQVQVPFGRQTKYGYVTGFKETSDFEKLRSIKKVIGGAPLIGEKVLELARWMSDYYITPLEKTLQTLIPGAVRNKDRSFREQLMVRPAARAEKASERAALAKAFPRRSEVLESLLVEQEMLQAELIQQTRTTSATLRALEKEGYITIEKAVVGRNPHAGKQLLPTEPLPLMPEQQVAYEGICRAMDREKPGVMLLYGVTGSGKTEVYLQALAHALEKGQDAIILVPEISLTPQTVERFRSRFGDRIAVLHSHLSDGERHDEWHRLYRGDARIAIGARSALFSPLRHLGLIVVDEEHESSYKQDEAPRYSARDVAVMRGHMEHCAVVLGSATPSLESYQNTRSGKYEMMRLTVRADHRPMPIMQVVDMRTQVSEEGKTPVFSSDLVNAVRDRLVGGEQVILFLNRRGFSTSLICPACGYVAMCPDCSVSLTYHKADQELKCHLCGRQVPVPERCPNPDCRDHRFKYAGFGTQRIEEIAGKLFPHARIKRMDSDTTRRKEAYEEILGAFRSGKIDILIGTQMIAKGLHFPNVTLVGVLNADVSLHMPDFRAGEKTFQLLTQVAGRAGRGEIPGEVIVQTFTPAHAAIQAARRLDYEGFSDQELAFREELGYPPFRRMACITVRGPDECVVNDATRTLFGILGRHVTAGMRLSEPCPAPIARIKTHYRYQLMLRASSVRSLGRTLRAALAEMKWPKEVQHSLDIDPVSLL
ncbi:MAG: primosomal protein N' [Kiritimatiellae bacterium]|nr:primosomal protein N' [Kiritimatiellia bacterium]MDD4734942.1 primosomal protein N' [Kiritimatiellia bacterium]